MKTEIKVPAMGESISEATVGAILKPAGSKVGADDELLELETDKVNQVLYAPQAGVLDLKVSPGDVVKIGQVIGTIDSDASAKAESAPSPTPQPADEAKKEEKEQPKQPAKAVSAPEKKAEPPQAAPTTDGGSTRKSKEDFIAEIKSGPKEEEVPKAVPSKEPQKEAAVPAKSTGERGFTRRKISKIRKVIASRLVEVKNTTAMLTTFNEVDLSEIIAIREKYKEKFLKEHGAKLGFMSFFVKASVSALKEFPDFNSFLEGDDIVHREFYDIGVAVGTDRGVIVPVIRDSENLTFADIEKTIEQFAKKARDGTITIDDLQGGGFTITNGGVYGSLLSTPILNPMQSGILGMHKIQKRPVVVDDQIVIRPMMYLALSYDHRIVDGKEAVSFLVHIKNCLEDPSRLLLEI